MSGPDYADVGWYWNWNDAPDKKIWEVISHTGFKNYMETVWVIGVVEVVPNITLGGVTSHRAKFT